MGNIYEVTAMNLADDANVVDEDLRHLLHAYELGGECRLRDEFDRIFSQRSILDRYLNRQQTYFTADNPLWLQTRFQELREAVE